jgi:hypothetical protein
VTYELLTGQVPWPQDKPFGRHEVVQAVVEDGWRPELVRPRPASPLRVVRVPRSAMAVCVPVGCAAPMATVMTAAPKSSAKIQSFDSLTNRVGLRLYIFFCI